MSRASQVALLARHALARRRAGASGRGRSTLERELEAVEVVFGALSRAGDAEAVARVLLDEIAELLDVQFVGLVLVDAELREARGLLARLGGDDFPSWNDAHFDLADQPSGVASAVFEAAPVVVYDLTDSTGLNRELARGAGARSAAFVPLVSGGRVIAVLAVATTEHRSFATDELAPIRPLVAEATLALERARSAAALAEALERERLVAEIGRRVRSELDLDALQRVAVEEAGTALGVDRCFIRTQLPSGGVEVVAEWQAPDLAAIGAAAALLPAANLAEELRQTVAIGDVAAASELDRGEGSTRQTLLELGTRSVLATPIVVLDEVVGVFAMHRRSPWEWLDTELTLAEAVAREVGLAMHTARLLRENELRLAQQTALVRAAQVLAGELRLEGVLQLLVGEVAGLMRCEVAACLFFDAERERLRFAAIHGLDDSALGFDFPASRGLSGRAIAEDQAVFTNDYETLRDPIPHPAFADLAGVLAAPMTWSGEIRGVLAVATRERSRVFDEGDADLLAGFASLASLALRNAEAFDERERQARVERSFARVASLLGESVSLAETLDALAHAVAEALDGSFAVVLLPGGQGLRAAGADRLPQPLAEAFAARLPDGAEVLAEAGRAGRMLTSSELSSDDRFGADFRSLAASAGCVALLAAPVVAPRSDDPGLVVVGFGAPRAFNDDEVELARHLASAARGALERSELFETERRARALSQQLAAIGSRLGAKLEPSAVLREVAAQAPTLLDADAASIQLLEDGELTVKAAAGRVASDLLETRRRGATGPAAEVLRTGEPVAIADVSDEWRSEAFLEAGHRAYLGVPLQGPQGLDGVLAVYSDAPRVWRAEEVEALGALAVTAVSSHANAELYQRVALERERSVAILGNVADGIVAVDRDGRVVLWNAAAEQITGVASNEALGRTLAQTLQRDLSQADAPAGEREVTIRRGSGEVRLSVTEAVMRDSLGDVAGRVFAFRDVSTEHVVEQMKTDFVSTVSHELRAPLTSIYGFAATLLREDIDFSAEERRTFLGYVASEASRLTAIVDQLLNLARLDTGDLEVELTSTDVRAIVADVVAEVEAAVPEGRGFVVDLPDEPVTARVDEQKLRQILASLVDNAVKYSPADAGVTVGARRTGSQIEIMVADEGPGIPAAERDRIFAKFYRLPSQGQGGGTGLGLSLAQGLVAAMGGRIRVESAEGAGSTFVVQLPAAEPAAPRQREVIA